MTSTGIEADLALVKEHVAKNAHAVCREGQPETYLTEKYLVPAGPYEQLWDWDAVFMGVGLFAYGGAPYLRGAMQNFFLHTDAETGEVPGCLTPKGPSKTLYHAKPVVVQGAWMACKYLRDNGDADPFVDIWSNRHAMEALCNYWIRERQDAETGLYVWHDQMESGADDLPTSPPRGEQTHRSLASADVMVFVYREFKSMSRFYEAWRSAGIDGADDDELRAGVERYEALAAAALQAMRRYLWDPERGHWVAYNVVARQPVTNRVFLMAFPLLEPETLPDRADRQRCVDNLRRPDMWTAFGVRSTSSDDPRYNNDNRWLPDSNWQGPVWIVSNCLLTYGLLASGRTDDATALAETITRLLATDLRVAGEWHECYNSETGSGLACAGFLSWNVMAATLLENVRAGINPYEL